MGTTGKRSAGSGQRRAGVDAVVAHVRQGLQGEARRVRWGVGAGGRAGAMVAGMGSPRLGEVSAACGCGCGAGPAVCGGPPRPWRWAWAGPAWRSSRQRLPGARLRCPAWPWRRTWPRRSARRRGRGVCSAARTAFGGRSARQLPPARRLAGPSGRPGARAYEPHEPHRPVGQRRQPSGRIAAPAPSGARRTVRGGGCGAVRGRGPWHDPRPGLRRAVGLRGAVGPAGPSAGSGPPSTTRRPRGGVGRDRSRRAVGGRDGQMVLPVQGVATRTR